MSEKHPDSQSSFRRFMENLLDVKTEDPVRLRRGRLVNVVILGALLIALVWLVVGGLSAFFAMRVAETSAVAGRLVLTVAILGVTYVLNRRSASPLAGLILALASLAGTLVMLVASGPLTTYVIGLTVPVLIAGLMGPPASAFVLATLAALTYGWLNVRHDPEYLSTFFSGASAAESFIVYLHLYIIAALGWLFSQMAGRAIRESHARVQVLLARQKELEDQLERQTLHMRATTNVVRALADWHEEEVLLRESVQVVRQFFHFDAVHLFVVDATEKVVVLRASTSPAGRQLIARRHSLPVGANSAVGQAAERGEPVVGDKRSVDLLLQRLEHSPDIRSELAVPLAIDGQVMGVLDVQSAKPDAFGAVDLPVFESLGEQLALAVAGARVHAEAQRNIRELSELSREATQRGWRSFLFGKTDENRVHRHGQGDAMWVDRQQNVVQMVLQTGEMASSVAPHKDAFSYLAMPMMLRNEVIGVVGVEADGVRHWTNDDVTIMRGISERATLAVENARLFEQARRTAQREQLINTIAGRLQSAPNLQILLEGVAAELGQALGTDQVYAEFTLRAPRAEGSGQPDDGQPALGSNGEEVGTSEHSVEEALPPHKETGPERSPNGDQSSGRADVESSTEPRDSGRKAR